MAARPVFGIDLGTTYSCVARLDDAGKPEVLDNDESQPTTPSVVYFEQDGDIVVGTQAKNELQQHPDRVVQHIKRRMGEPGFSIEFDGRPYFPQQISAKILEYVVTEAMTAIGAERGDGPLADVVITVPAYFGSAERSATRTAGELAGLNVLSIINEPTAAAMAYGLLRPEDERVVLVYDLGGGTFDATLVEASADRIRAVATHGNRELGGADWDAVLGDMVLDAYRDQHPDAPDPTTDVDAAGELPLVVEDAKKALTRKERHRVTFTAHGRRAPVELTREEFADQTRALVDRTLHYTELVLDAAKDKGVTRIDEVVLVGGMSRVPAIVAALTEKLTERYGRAPEPRLVDPDQIVAKGAALFAASAVAEHYGEHPGADGPSQVEGELVPTGRPLPALVDITSRGYGILAVHDARSTTQHVSWIIRPQDELPATRTEQYETIEYGQTRVEIVVHESRANVLTEDPAASNELIRGWLTGLPSGRPAGQPLEVTHTLGTDGVLRIEARGPSGQVLNLEYTLPGAVPPEELARPLPALARY